MEKQYIRILGFGSLLMGDDGIGVRIVQELERRAPDIPCLKDVEIYDLGVCGLDMLPFLDDVENVIMVDAVKSGESIGSILRFTGADLLEGREIGGLLSAHDITVPETLKIAEALQGLPNIIFIGISIRAPMNVYDFTTELSPPVEKSFERAIDAVINEVEQLLESREKQLLESRENSENSGNSE
ncbi:MAG: hydrogenase maturation protease [Methanosarcinaceae archaeon]|nr:hydrogenase maturation protease [Methanosarcinaceae archaeon]